MLLANIKLWQINACNRAVFHIKNDQVMLALLYMCTLIFSLIIRYCATQVTMPITTPGQRGELIVGETKWCHGWTRTPGSQLLGLNPWPTLNKQCKCWRTASHLCVSFFSSVQRGNNDYLTELLWDLNMLMQFLKSILASFLTLKNVIRLVPFQENVSLSREKISNLDSVRCRLHLIFGLKKY